MIYIAKVNSDNSAPLKLISFGPYSYVRKAYYCSPLSYLLIEYVFNLWRRSKHLTRQSGLININLSGLWSFDW